MAQFRDLLRQVMADRKIKAIDVSRMTGLGSGTISMYLSGQRNPKMENIRKIANALNVSELWLLGLGQDQEVQHGKD